MARRAARPGRHAAGLAPPDVPVVGSGSGAVLQRRLHPERGRPSPPDGHGPARARLLARDLAGDRPTDRSRHAARRIDLARGPAGADHAPRPYAGCLLDLQLLAGTAGRRCYRRRAGGVQRDHRAHGGGAPAGGTGPSGRRAGAAAATHGRPVRRRHDGAAPCRAGRAGCRAAALDRRRGAAARGAGLHRRQRPRGRTRRLRRGGAGRVAGRAARPVRDAASRRAGAPGRRDSAVRARPCRTHHRRHAAAAAADRTAASRADVPRGRPEPAPAGRRRLPQLPAAVGRCAVRVDRPQCVGDRARPRQRGV